MIVIQTAGRDSRYNIGSTSARLLNLSDIKFKLTGELNMGKYSKTTKTIPESTHHLKHLCSSHLSNNDCAYYQIIMLGKKNKYVDTVNIIQDLKLCPIQNYDLPKSPLQQIYTLLKVLPEKYKRGLLISCLKNESNVILSTMFIELDENLRIPVKPATHSGQNLTTWMTLPIH